MIDRRHLLASAALLTGTLLMPSRSRADVGALSVASVKFGSLSWLLETIKAEGLDTKVGLQLEVREVATNQAAPLVLLSGSTDVIVSDWMWALRQRAMGEPMKFSPFSLALGALMVPEGSAIKGLADLKGKKLGVAGSAIDKSWLLLRAYSRKVLGADIAQMVTPVFAAAPLITEQIRDGQLDAVLNFWTFAARMSGNGYRSVLTMADVLKTLEIDPVPAFVGFIWKEATEKDRGPAIEALLDAAAAANAVLAQSDAAWERLRPLIRPATDAEFAAIKVGYRAGIPGPWRSAEMQSAEKVMKLLVEAGDTELVGEGTRFDPKLFHAAS